MSASAQNPSQQPVLHTARLLLRPFVPEDASLLAQLAGKHRVADTTASIPHPYSPEQALEDIRRFTDEFSRDVGAYFAIALREAPQSLIGCALLKLIDRRDEQGELGYWIDEDATGKGFATEAARSLLDYGFNALCLNRICANHMTRNPASGRILEKLGMQKEGLLRQGAKKWGVYEDLLIWAVLRDEFNSLNSGQ